MAEMSPQHTRALIVAYYLSKFDKVAVRSLGFNQAATAFRSVGEVLGVKSTSVKNMRDEFDVLHGNGRVGWRNRPMHPTRIRIDELFGQMCEEELRATVVQILRGQDSGVVDVQHILELESKSNSEASVASRGQTGAQAENYIIQLAKNGMLPFSGTLLDKRLDACGYDFEIRSRLRPNSLMLEVKGIIGDRGSILMTDIRIA